MAQTWPAKAPTEVVERRWTVPFDDGDGIATIATSATGVTVDSTDDDGTDAIITLSAGTAGVEATVTVTVVSDDGLTFAETFLIAIRATTTGLNYTARDVCGAAMDKIAGGDAEMTAEESARALKRLNEMLALWRIDGLDIGVAAPLVLTDPVDVPDEFVPALIFNLRVAMQAHHGTPEPYDVQMAEAGKRLIANRLLSFDDLSFSQTLARPTWSEPLN